MHFGWSRKSKRPESNRAIRARFDVAQTTVGNARHWANADNLSADSSASAYVRRTIRSRSRYEVANNSYARGIVLTLANDCIGTGPRLQWQGKSKDSARRVERAFSDWSAEVQLAEKLRTMRMAKTTDGETFMILTSNPDLESQIKLDIQLVEADRIASWNVRLVNGKDIDGIEYNEHGVPRSYHVLKIHPGELLAGPADLGDFDLIDASAMIHWFRVDRPGQHRGIPEITPALPLFAQLRRYTLAVLAAAETAADFAAVLYTDAPANGESTAVEPMDVIELEKSMATVLPDGWKLGQIKAEQPGTAYTDFKHEIINEIARCLNMPFNIAAGNSSGYNYASGRLDHQTYYKSISIEQSSCAMVVLDRILSTWIYEAELLTDFSSIRNQPADHQWFWTGTEHVDPAKEARAQQLRLSNNTTTLAAEYARQGKDWETELRQRAKENVLMNTLGLSAVGAA